MLLLTGVIELKWLARRHSSNCHLEKVLSVFKFPYSLSGWGSQYSASGTSIRSDASVRVGALSPTSPKTCRSQWERDTRINNLTRRSPVCKWSSAFCSFGADQWGCKYGGNSGNLNVPVTQPPMVQVYKRAEPRKDAAQLAAAVLLTHHSLSTRTNKA